MTRTYTDILHIDFETYYDRDYSLSKIPTILYVRDMRFKVLGVAVALNDEPSKFLNHEEFVRMAQEIDWSITAVSAYNCAFDACILTERYGIYPAYYICPQSAARALIPLDRVNLRVVAPTLGIGEKGDALTPGSYAVTKELSDYACQDNELARKIYKLLYPMLPKFEQDLIDQTVQQAVEPIVDLDTKVLTAVRDKAEEERNRAIEASGYTDEQLTSNPQFAKIIRDLGLVPPTKISPTTGDETEAFAKGDDEFVEFMLAYPEYLNIWEGRLAAKSNINQRRAERLLEVAATGPMPMPLHYHGAHCVPGETEVLTRQGWQRIDGWNGEDIMQVYPQSRTMAFLPATLYTGPILRGWVTANSPLLSMQLSYGHTVPYLTDSKRTSWATMEALELIARSCVRIPVIGEFYGQGSNVISPEQARVLAMVQADANFNNRSQRRTIIRLKFKKLRKIIRARGTLQAANINYTERLEASGLVTFYIAADNIPEWLTEQCKQLGPWLLDLSFESRRAFIDEALYWDGDLSTEHQRYSTAIKENAEWMYTLCTITGQRASISVYSAEGKNTQYRVSIRRRNSVYATLRTQKHFVKAQDIAQRAYCPTTQTGFWLARHKGTIFITGNTGRWSGADKFNVQNLPSHRKSDLRKAFTAPKGHVIVVADSSQIELRLNMWFCRQMDKVELLRNGGDIYKTEAATQFNIAENDVIPMQRQFGKCVQLGCIAEDTLVLVRKNGCTPFYTSIQSITNEHQLWDGIEWVNHQGLLDRGVKTVINVNGAWMTPDHKVLCDGTWTEAQYLERDPSTLLRASATGSANLPLPALNLARVADSTISWFGVLAAQTNTVHKFITFVAESLRDVITVQKNKLGITVRNISDTPILCPKTLIARDCSIGYRRRLIGVTTPGTRGTKIMAGEASPYFQNGELTGANTWPISSLLLGGTIRRCSLTVSTIISDMSLTIFDLFRRLKTQKIKEPFLRFKRNWTDSTKRMKTYDVAYAGTNHRFTIKTATGHFLVHNCGYGMGAIKFRKYCAAGPMGLDPIYLTPEQSYASIYTYRAGNEQIPEMWRYLDQMIHVMTLPSTTFYPFEHCEIKIVHEGIQLPTGRQLQYPGIQQTEEGGWIYGIDRKRKFIWGGTLLENLIQAMARDIVAKQLLQIRERYRIISSTHDEVIYLAPEYEADEALAFGLEVMSQTPDWAPELPISAEGAYDYYYCK